MVVVLFTGDCKVADVTVIAIIVILDDCVHLFTLFKKKIWWFWGVRMMKWG